jgi:hypothetical protein
MIMRKLVIALTAVSALGLAGCTTNEKIASGVGIGAAVGGLASNSLGGAIIGGVVGGVATAIIVKNDGNGWCTYRARDGHLFRAHCRY